MEAPEKIYRTTTYLENNKGKTLWKTKPVAGAENIGYARIDAFIEKAEKYLLEHLIDYWSQGVTDESGFIEGFKEYMKGE